MSLERACVNCERCYHLANLAIKDYWRVKFESVINVGNESHEEKQARIKTLKINSKIRKATGYENDQVYVVRNEAMRAVWDVFMYLSDKEDDVWVDVKDALQACRNCDYSSPRILETIEHLSKPKEE